MKHLWAILTIVVCSPFIIAQETIAVVDFNGKGVSDIEASALTDRFASELFNLGVYRLIERERVGEILEEQGFQQSGCTTAECAVEVGKMLGTELIITGSISKVGNVFSVSSRIINVESGEIYKMSNYDYQGDIGQLLMTGMSISVNKLVSGKTPKVIERIKEGALVITSNPHSISILISDISLNPDKGVAERTPIRIENAPAGKYQILSNKLATFDEDDEIINYETFLDTVEVIDKETTTLNIVLKKSSPTFSIISNLDATTGARVYIDTGKVNKDFPSGNYWEKRTPTSSEIEGSELWKSGIYKVFVAMEGYYIYSDSLILEEGKRTDLYLDLYRKPGSLFIQSSLIANYELNGQDNAGLYEGETNRILKEVPGGRYRLEVRKEGYLTTIIEYDKSDWNDDSVHVSLMSIDSLEKELVSLKWKRKLWFGGGLTLAATGSLFWHSAEKNYEKYQTAGTDADDIFSTVETQDKLYPILFGVGGVGLASGLNFQLKIMKLNKMLDDGFIKE
jgi:hypothetical protein